MSKLTIITCIYVHNYVHDDIIVSKIIDSQQPYLDSTYNILTYVRMYVHVSVAKLTQFLTCEQVHV